MKILLILTLLFSLQAFGSEEENCEYPIMEPILDNGNMNMIKEVSTALKKDFKRRPMNVKGFNLALSIETNFEVPLIGADIYWGRIYLNQNDPKNIVYRDDLIAEANYKKEKANPGNFNYSNYSVASINSAKGLSLVKAAGADVNVKSTDGKFSTRTGGRLTIKVKAPNENPTNLLMDVVNNNGKITKSLIVGSKKIPFDSFKINAEKNMFGVTSILSGIDTIQFYSAGKVIHTITQ